MQVSNVITFLAKLKMEQTGLDSTEGAHNDNKKSQMKKSEKAVKIVI